jgi:signal transduction histidine kinase
MPPKKFTPAQFASSGGDPVGVESELTELRERLAEEGRRTRNLLASSERELERVGRDLHDTLGQHITGLSMLHSTLVRKLVEKDVPEAETAKQIAAMLDKARTDLRRISRSVHGIGEGECALASRLQDFASDLEEVRQIKCSIECEEPVRLEPLVATQLFRIVQRWVLRSAGGRNATQVGIRLKRIREHYLLEIDDDGDLSGDESAASEGCDTATLADLVAVFGGAIHVRARKPCGMILRCRFLAARAA